MALAAQWTLRLYAFLDVCANVHISVCLLKHFNRSLKAQEIRGSCCPCGLSMWADCWKSFRTEIWSCGPPFYNMLCSPWLLEWKPYLWNVTYNPWVLSLFWNLQTRFALLFLWTCDLKMWPHFNPFNKLHFFSSQHPARYFSLLEELSPLSFLKPPTPPFSLSSILSPSSSQLKHCFLSQVPPDCSDKIGFYSFMCS